MKVQKETELKTKHFRVWNTKLVNEVKNMIEIGEIPKDSPFITNDHQWRSPDITFEYTAEELEEIQKCASDVVYFANMYAYSMTDEGVQKITIRDYQEEALKDLQNNRFNIWMASRQVGKCLLHNVNITVRNTTSGEIIKTTLGNFYEKLLSKKRKMSFLERIKSFLWKMYTNLS